MLKEDITKKYISQCILSVSIEQHKLSSFKHFFTVLEKLNNRKWTLYFLFQLNMSLI